MNLQLLHVKRQARLLAIGEHLARAARAFMERNTFWSLCGFSLLYLTWTLLLASQKLLWNDELYTYHIALLPGPTHIWSALMTGAEQIPPSFHLLTRGVLHLFGVNNISIRLPEMLGFLAMMLCLFRFVAKRSSPFYGFVAMGFPLITGAYKYAYEARPYGLVLGFSGLALICWQAAAEGQRRKLALVFLTLSLVGALASHYYAILVFFALGVGEIARSLSRRRLDLPIWLAFAVAAVVPILLFSPLILQSRTYAGTFWARVSLSQVPRFYQGLLQPATVPLAVTLLLAATYTMFRPAAPHPEPRRQLPLHELAAALGFLVLPPVAFTIVTLVTNAFVGRYVLPTVIGFSILVAFALYSLPRGRALIGTALLLFMSGWFTVTQLQTLRTTVETSRDRFEAIQLLQSEGDPYLPIVASEPHIFMALAYYAPPDITSRLVYLGDPEASLRRLGHNSVDRGMLDLIGPWFHLPVKEYRPYIRSHRRFLVYGNVGWLAWLPDELQADNMRLELEARRKDEFLFLVSAPE